VYNAQHDCHLAKCTASGKRLLLQERVESGLTETVIEHDAVDRFVINTHAFHNAHLLREMLPRSLVAPISLYQDRQTKHTEIAKKLRTSQENKRATAKARAADKKRAAVEVLDLDSKQKKLRTDPVDNGGQAFIWIGSFSL
jgi:hypothetical protein